MISTSVETITPEIAKKYLKLNFHGNRNVRWATVKAYAADIRSGKWDLNNSTIGFDEDGNLVDGQHRMLAIIEAETPAKMIVVRGLNRDAIHTIDSGRGRPMSYRLSLKSGNDSLYNANTAALVRTIERHLCGMEDRSVLSTDEIAVLIDKWRGACEYMNYVRGRTKHSSALVIAQLSAMDYGVPLSIIKAFNSCVSSNKIDTNVHAVNWKAALDFDVRTSHGGSQSNTNMTEAIMSSKRSIYMFANDIRRCSRDVDWYPESELMFKAFSDLIIGKDWENE